MCEFLSIYQRLYVFPELGLKPLKTFKWREILKKNKKNRPPVVYSKISISKMTVIILTLLSGEKKCFLPVFLI